MSALAGAPLPSVAHESTMEELATEEPARHQNARASTPAKEELHTEVPWVPRMDAIRKAQVAEVEALEEIVGALASKQQTSVTKLREQVDTILAWRAQIITKERNVAARRAGTNATDRAKVAGAELPEAKRAQGAEKTDALATSTDIDAIGGSGDQSDAVSSALFVEDNEDWAAVLEEPTEQGRCSEFVSIPLLVRLLFNRSPSKQT